MGTAMKFRRKLDASDLQRMNLPEEFWLVRVENAPESIRRKLARYLKRIHEAAAKGAGLLVTGAPGVGKSAAAALVLKEARACGYTGFFTAIWELREMVRAKVMFDDETSIMGRCFEVDFLVLDGMREEDAKERWFGLKEIEELIRYRGSKRLVTILTTQMSISDMDEDKSFESLLEASQGYLVPFPVEGENLREAREEALRRSLLDE